MSLPPIKAHQQVPLPLLRRPRPPPKRVSEDQLNSTATSISRNITKSVAEDLLDSELVQEKLKSTSTPVYHLPRHHPTPSSPHRHPFTPHTIIQHTSPQHQSHSPINEDRDEAFSPRDLTSAESLKNDNIIIHSLFPRGPEFFPQRKMRLKKHKSTPRNWKKEEEAGDLGFRTFAPPEQGGPRFSELDPEEAALYEPPPTKLRGNFISRQNYLKLTGWFATHVPHQEALNTLDITVDHCAPEGRKPYHQLILELAALIDSAIESDRWREDREGGGGKRGGEGGSGERGGEGGGGERGGEGSGGVQWPSPQPGDIVFQSSTSRYFCGEGRSDSPFDSGGQPLISPAEVAILESMMDGGYRLSLKAHFLSSLPLLSPLSLTLTHLNLSFNNLNIFPNEVLDMTQLLSLRMRNNPVRDIPNDICKLEKLEDFCISFNLLTHLPSGLFELCCLTRLDVAHNALQELPRDICKLRNLCKLNVESNELIGLPPSLLSLPLSQLLVSGNYIHPALWKENCRSPPQALVDTCCTVVTAAINDANLPSSVQDILHHRSQPNVCCDFCRNPIFGPELKVIKSMKSAADSFPVKSLPVLFIACSLNCKNNS